MTATVSPPARPALDGLDDSVRSRLDRARAAARGEGLALWWAGGGVRDLLLGRPVVDLDLVVERGAEGVSRRLAASESAEVVLHPRFLSATIELADGARIDVATARREVYAAPGALPEVAPATLVEDLGRRDFSINAVALRLEPEPEEWVDPFGGAADLAAGRLRILHAGSFDDDPTRILRGIRFETRLGFAFDGATEAAARRALAAGRLAALSSDRLRVELEAALESWTALVPAATRMAGIGLLDALAGPAPRPFERLAAAVRLRERPDWPAPPDGARPAGPGRLLRLWLALGLDDAGRRSLATRLGLGGRDRAELLDVPTRIAELLAEADAEPEPALHRVAGRTALAAPEELLLAGAASARAADRIARAEARRREIALGIDGDDLIAAGVDPGPALGRALRRTWEARLDGVLRREDELAFAVRQAGEGAP